MYVIMLPIACRQLRAHPLISGARELASLGCQLKTYLSAMEIHYRSKDESNRAQRETFLKLTPTERFYAFLELSERMKDFPSKNPPQKRTMAILQS